jgi:histidinol-phosphatase
MARSARLETALAAAAAAAELVRTHYRGSVAARIKPDGSPVTDADVAVEEAIRRIVNARFPDDGFYGEESAALRMDAEHLWVVDPIDGTKSFVRRYPMFSTQIAVMRRGRIELGVSCAPVWGETAWAERGSGAFLDGSPLAVSRIASIEQATLSTGNLRSLARGPRWPAFGRLVTRLDRIRGFGDFLHYHLLAAGKIEAVIESDIHILDVAALTAIVEEAGGRVTDLQGKPIGLATTSILASNGVLHDAVLSALDG